MTKQNLRTDASTTPCDEGLRELTPEEAALVSGGGLLPSGPLGGITDPTPQGVVASGPLGG